MSAGTSGAFVPKARIHDEEWRVGRWEIAALVWICALAGAEMFTALTGAPYYSVGSSILVVIAFVAIAAAFRPIGPRWMPEPELESSPAQSGDPQPAPTAPVIAGA